MTSPAASAAALEGPNIGRDPTSRPAHLPSPTPDAALLVAIADGQLQALQELYGRYQLLAYSRALRVTRDAALAEDVVQEAFLSAWRSAAAYVADRGSVKAWLLVMVHHRAVDELRRRRPTIELPTPEDVSPTALQFPDAWPDVAARLDFELIQAGLTSLPAAQREAIELSYFRGLTQQQIAEHTRTPLGTVKSRVRLGLLALRRGLEGKAVPAEEARSEASSPAWSLSRTSTRR